MNAISFMKLDFRLTKGQLKIVLLFIAVGIFLGFQGKSMVAASGYMCFGFTIIASTPFVTHFGGGSGLYELLPAKVSSKVWGRFLYYTMMLLISVVVGVVMLIVSPLIGWDVGLLDWMFFTIFPTLGLIFGYIQFVAYYKLGEMKSQIMANFFRMLPGFIIFFLSSYLTGLEISSLNSKMEGIVLFALDNPYIIVAGEIFLVIITLILCVAISTKICENKDM